MRIVFSLLLLAGFNCFAQEEAGLEPAKRYGFKSAIAKVSMDMMGQKIEATDYIDDYGARQCRKTKIEIPGMGEVEAATILKDGKSWSVNYTMKQVLEVPVKGDMPNFMDLSDETVAKFRIQEAGKETLLDRECTKYTLEVDVQGMRSKVIASVYKGLALKTEMEIGGMMVVATVTSLQEEAMVLPQVFDVPDY